MLAQHRLELAAVLAAGVSVRSVHAAAVPSQPRAGGLSVDVLAVAQVEQLVLERDLRLGVRRASQISHLKTTETGTIEPVALGSGVGSRW